MGCLCSKQADQDGPSSRSNARKPSFVAQTQKYEKAADGGTEMALQAVQGGAGGKTAKQLGLEKFDKAILKPELCEYANITDIYDFGKKLGTGAFASIYTVTDTSVSICCLIGNVNPWNDCRSSFAGEPAEEVCLQVGRQDQAERARATHQEGSPARAAR